MNAKDKSLTTPTTQVCECRCQRLTRCYGSRKVSHVFASTLSLLPRGVIFKLSTKILTAILLIYHAAGASTCRFHIIAQESSDKILTHSQSRSMHRKRTYIVSRLLEVKGKLGQNVQFLHEYGLWNTAEGEQK